MTGSNSIYPEQNRAEINHGTVTEAAEAGNNIVREQIFFPEISGQRLKLQEKFYHLAKQILEGKRDPIDNTINSTDNERLINFLIYHYNFSYLDLSDQWAKVTDSSLINEYFTQGYFIFKNRNNIDDNDTTYLAINNLNLLTNIKPENYVGIFLITKNNLYDLLERDFNLLNTDKARFYLELQDGPLTARNIDYKKLTTGFIILFMGFLLFTTGCFHFVNNLIYLSEIIFKFILFKRAAFSNPDPVLPHFNKELPIYTILVPLYQEIHTLETLITVIDRLNYPKVKLDVKFIVEEDDELTIKALMAFNIPDYIHLIKVPYSLPRTKPKALNYAMNYVKGEYLVIYDAEDRPEPDQLLIALGAFEALPGNYACMQAKLNFYNSKENILTRLFSIEYSLWFEFLLKGLTLYDFPTTLGGTSNHFKVHILNKIGYWDAFNVTEDADLGIRLYLNGYKVWIIDSITLEEAPNQLGNWLKQRARWVKGFIQTILVFYLRSRCCKNLNLLEIVTIYIFVGFSSYSFFSLPWIYLSILTVGNKVIYYLWAVTGFISLSYLYISVLLILSTRRSSSARNNNKHFRNPSIRSLSFKDYVVLILWPFYFILHIAATYRAVWEIFITPFKWNKTDHGLSTDQPGNSKT